MLLLRGLSRICFQTSKAEKLKAKVTQILITLEQEYIRCCKIFPRVSEKSIQM